MHITKETRKKKSKQNRRKREVLFKFGIGIFSQYPSAKQCESNCSRMKNGLIKSEKKEILKSHDFKLESREANYNVREKRNKIEKRTDIKVVSNVPKVEEKLYNQFSAMTNKTNNIYSLLLNEDQADEQDLEETQIKIVVKKERKKHKSRKKCNN